MNDQNLNEEDLENIIVKQFYEKQHGKEFENIYWYKLLTVTDKQRFFKYLTLSTGY